MLKYVETTSIMKLKLFFLIIASSLFLTSCLNEQFFDVRGTILETGENVPITYAKDKDDLVKNRLTKGDTVIAKEAYIGEHQYVLIGKKEPVLKVFPELATDSNYVEIVMTEIKEVQ